MLDKVPTKVAKRLVDTFEAEDMEAANTLLGYTPQSVGRRMSPAPVRCSPG